MSLKNYLQGKILYTDWIGFSGIVLDLEDDGFTLKILNSKGTIRTNILMAHSFLDEKTIKLKLLGFDWPFLIKLHE